MDYWDFFQNFWTFEFDPSLSLGFVAFLFVALGIAQVATILVLWVDHTAWWLFALIVPILWVSFGIPFITYLAHLWGVY